MTLFSHVMLLSSICGIVIVEGWSSGAPPKACGIDTDIEPSHRGFASTNPLPYTVDLQEFNNSKYSAGQTYTITMAGGENDFRGFMIQGRVVADDSPTGTFAVSGVNYQAQCGNNTAATHTNNNDKRSVTLSWTAPPARTGAVRFRFAFVATYSVYWADIFTATINEDGSPDIDEGPFIPLPNSIAAEHSTVKIGSPAYIIDGFDLTIVCITVSGTPSITTRWFQNGVFDPSWMNASTITILNVGLNMIGDNYTCRADNDVGYDEHTTTVYVFDPPQFLPSQLVTDDESDSLNVAVSIGSLSRRIRTGSIVLVYCNVTGVDIPTIEWYKDGTLINTSGKLIISSNSYNTEILIIKNFQAHDSGTYECKAANVAGVAHENITLESFCSACRPPAVETLNPDPDECPICGAWSECTCRSGVQFCSVTCIDINHSNVRVNDSFCNSTIRPEEDESSGMDLCNNGWRIGTWSMCSHSCHSGSQVRVVECVWRGMILPDSECDDNIQPVSQQPCNEHIPCTSKPQITAHPMDVIVEINNDTTSVQLTCMAAGATSYYWMRRGSDDIPSDAVGSQTNTLTLVKITPPDAGEYRCVAVNEHGRNYSDYAKLTIKARPPMVTVTPLSVSASKGQRVMFSCSANSVGVDTLVYGWILNGVPIDGEAGMTLTVTTSIDNSGNYQCTARNEYNGFGQSPVATLILNQFCDSVTVQYTGFTVTWDETPVGATVDMPCTGRGLNGTVQRRCKGDNEWQELINCFRVEAVVLLNQSMNLVASVDELNETERIRIAEEIATMLAKFTADQPVYAAEIDIAVNIVSSLNSVTSTVVNKLDPADMFFEESSIVIDNLLSETNRNAWKQLEQTSPETSQALVNSTQQFGRILGETLHNETTRAIKAKSNFIVKAQRLSNENVQAGDDYVFPDEQDNITSFTGEDTQIMVPNKVLKNVMEQLSPNTTGFAITNTVLRVDSLLLPNPTNGSDTILLISPIFSALLPVDIDTTDEQPIIMKFDVKSRSQVSDLSQTGSEALQVRTCGFYDHNILDIELNQAGGWSQEGVKLDKDNSNETTVTCYTTHLTSFAVLVTVQDGSPCTADKALSLISLIGCAISLVCLCLAIVILAYVIVRTKDRINQLFIHLNLSIALALGLVVFLAGIETATKHRVACVVVAALLHYFFTSAFCWMLCEGVILYMMLVTVFGNKLNRLRFFFILGWGPAIPIVAISVGLVHEYYGNDDYCWISSENGAIAAFIAPIVTVIMINVIFLGIALKVLYTSRNDNNISASKDTAKEMLKAIIVLLPLLGLTWIVGILAVNENTQIFAWIFAILNSLQGVFIFVNHVLRNKQVGRTLRERYHIWRSGGMYSVYIRTRSTRGSSCATGGTLKEKTPEHNSIHPLTKDLASANGVMDKRAKPQIEFASNVSDDSTRDDEPQIMMITFKGSLRREVGTVLKQQERTDRIKDNRLIGNLKNKSFNEDYFGVGDGQASTFKSDSEVQVNANGHGEAIPTS